MIYDFTVDIRNSKGKRVTKQFYLSADSKSQFYKLIKDMYRLDPKEVIIQREIADEGIDVGVHKEVPKKIVDNELRIKFQSIVNDKIYGRTQDFFDEKAKNCYVAPIKLTEDSLCPIISKYDKVKIYYLKTGAKKDKKYFAICK